MHSILKFSLNILVSVLLFFSCSHAFTAFFHLAIMCKQFHVLNAGKFTVICMYTETDRAHA